MGTEQMTAQEVFAIYKTDMEKLIAYLPWLEEKSGRARVSQFYRGSEFTEGTMSFPVYDGNLLRFIKEAENTKFMDRNYVYVISRNRLKTTDDEIRFVNAQNMIQLTNIGGILSKYVMGGRTKGRMWSEAVDSGVFLTIVKKFKELYELELNNMSE